MTVRPTSRPKKGVALAIMAKIPHPGACKTRLVPPLTHDEAAALSERFLRDTVANVAAVARATGATVVGAYTPEASDRRLAELFGPKVVLLAQRGGDFGARLYNVALDLFSAGHGGVCLIDSDSPTLPPASLAQSVRALEGRGDRLVIGPALDGGYYLIGMKRPQLALFSGIAWSTSSVFDQTLEAATRMRLGTTVLPQWYDVDDAAGLRLISRELLGSDGTAGFPAPLTRAFLETLPHARSYLSEAIG